MTDVNGSAISAAYPVMDRTERFFPMDKGPGTLIFFLVTLQTIK
jgi:hypothetical protein